jgi:non-canonical purine NTP pyrophosphatase (RdgB/HAM1 family)
LEAKKEMEPVLIEQKEIDLAEIQSLDSREVIEHKLKEAQKHFKGEFIVEDVSFELECLNGFPGPLIKWFLKSNGRKGIYELCKAKNEYGVKAKATIGYTDGKKIEFFEGVVEGKIVEPKEDSFNIWDLKPNGLDKTLTEMTPEEKNKISHRGIAVRKFKEWYNSKKN